jgi:hypothetical protein
VRGREIVYINAGGIERKKENQIIKSIAQIKPKENRDWKLEMGGFF